MQLAGTCKAHAGRKPLPCTVRCRRWCRSSHLLSAMAASVDSVICLQLNGKGKQVSGAAHGREGRCLRWVHVAGSAPCCSNAQPRLSGHRRSTTVLLYAFGERRSVLTLKLVRERLGLAQAGVASVGPGQAAEKLCVCQDKVRCLKTMVDPAVRGSWMERSHGNPVTRVINTGPCTCQAAIIASKLRPSRGCVKSPCAVVRGCWCCIPASLAGWPASIAPARHFNGYKSIIQSTLDIHLHRFVFNHRHQDDDFAL